MVTPPFALLRGHVGGGNDAKIGIDEEQGEDFAMAFFGRIGKAKGGDAVLEDVGEGEEAAFEAEDVADFLNRGGIVGAPKDPAEPFVVVLFVSNIPRGVGRALVPEREARTRDVRAGVIVQGSGADVFVLGEKEGSGY